MQMKIGDAQVEVTWDEESDKLHGQVLSAPGLRAGDTVEFYAETPDDLARECRISLEVYAEVRVEADVEVDP